MDEDRPVCHALHDPAGSAAYDDSDKTSRNTDHDSLDEELAQNINATCADGHTQTDFTGTFGDGYVHNIHDTDTAHYQRYSGNSGGALFNLYGEVIGITNAKYSSSSSSSTAAIDNIGSLENGRYNPSIQLAFKIARYFNMSIEEIFIYEED